MNIPVKSALVIGCLLIAVLNLADAHKRRKARNRWDHETEYLPDMEPQWCTTKYKAKKLGYPVGCKESWCDRWWWWAKSCCFEPVFTIMDVEEDICCPGYFGKYCDRPICKESCPAGETCIKPNTCGTLVLCEGRCENGGTCTGLETCTCHAGYTGGHCETALSSCTLACLNGGTCQDGKCACMSPFTGPYCETPV